jgi:hypothetical protein
MTSLPSASHQAGGAPCAEWALTLAAPEEDLPAPERAALERHVASCPACSAARDDYRRMDAQIRALPAPRPLAGLPPALLTEWQREAAIRAHVADDDATHEQDRTSTAALTRAARSRGRASSALQALAAIVILCALLGGYYAVMGMRGTLTGGQTGNGPIHYGPPVDPVGPMAHIGPWRTLTLPPGAPDRAQQMAQPGAANGHPTGGAAIYEQPAVAGLLYAISPPAGTTPTRMWRSEDAGRTWVAIALPAAMAALPTDAQVLFQVDARAPDTVFLWGNTAGAAPGVRSQVYSLDRGATWHTLHMPEGSDAWDVTVPLADHNAWYLPVSVAAQPAIWVTRDHGATWRSYAYPVKLPTSVRAPSPPMGMLLTVNYSGGGLLWTYQHTLWWSPDDGATWRQLGPWGKQPCDGQIVGTPDLSVLYCLFSTGVQVTGGPLDQRPIWRSDDRGQTWVPVPGGPPVRPLAGEPFWMTLAHILYDGSLLMLAPSQEYPTELAFYTLKRGANVWHEASTPLPLPLGYCPHSQNTQPQNGGSLTGIGAECATPLEVTTTTGPSPTGMTSQLLYLTHAADNAVTNPVYVATITWQ